MRTGTLKGSPFIFLSFLLFLMHFQLAKGQSKIFNQNWERLDSLLTSANYNQIPLIYELQYRENDSVPLLGSQFYTYSNFDLYLANAILRQFTKTGEVPNSTAVEGFLASSPLFGFLDSVVDSEIYNEGAERVINDDSRVLLSDEAVSWGLRKAAQSISVIVIPANVKFAMPASVGAYTTKRKQSFQFWDSQHQGPKIRFQDEYSFANGTRSGILWSADTVLTAGHGLMKDDSVYVFSQFSGYRDESNLSIPDTNVRVGKIIMVISGGPHEPDYAIIHLTPNFSSASLTGSGIWAKLDKEKPIVAAGHPFGMQSIADIAGAILDAPAHHWQDSIYFFADLDMNKANSGSPVFQKDTTGGATNYYLVGMVVGSGGIEDFAVKDQKIVWNQLEANQVIGTRILSSSQIQDQINSTIRNKKPREFDGAIESISFTDSSSAPHDTCNRCLSSPNERTVTFNLNKKFVYFKGDSLIVQDKRGDTIVDYSLSYPAIFEMKDSFLIVRFQCSLADYYRCNLPPRSLQFHTDLWPLGLMSNPTHHLEFRYQETLPADMPYPHDSTEKFNMLDGIGLADIIDNLPDGIKMRRRQIWFCNKDMLEISITPAVGKNPYQAPIVNIRYVRPFVHSYLRTEPDEWPMK
jgi:hypothetical protein